jgi:molecular chaperone DnaK
MIGPTEQALKDAHLTSAEIERVLLVGGSTRMPAVQALVRTMFDKEPYKGINPDEAVAQGAALQAGIISGDVTDLVLIDVMPLSLGIETKGGVFTKLIERNSAIPTSHSQQFTTAVDNQSAVDIHVLQGERDFAIDNKTLGKFQLTGIPPAPQGVPRIEVDFEIDVNGIVNVTARDIATGHEQKVTITASSSLSRDDVDRMVAEATTNRRVDGKRREATEVKNKAEQKVYTAQRLIRDAKDVAPPTILRELTRAAGTVQDALNRSDISEANRTSAALDDLIMEVSKAMYESKSTLGDADRSGYGHTHADELGGGLTSALSGFAGDENEAIPFPTDEADEPLPMSGGASEV